MPEDVQPLFAQYISAPGRLREAITGLDPAALNRPGKEGWSIRDVVLHLSDVEMAAGTRFRMMVAGEEPPIEAFDEGVWKRRLHYLFRDPDAAMAVFQICRFATAELLQQLDKASWDKTGMHSEMGRVTVRDLFERQVAHVEEHIGQIGALRGG
jgi:uncharacterized damage-inducible protein DinB